MIFQKAAPKAVVDNELLERASDVELSRQHDEVETVVGPSVNVEGDFASEGNIIVKGSVAGSVHTSRHLSVEQGAKIMANVRAGSAKIAGEVKGNMKVKETLELTSTAKVIGDIEVKTLVIEGGALVYGKIIMPGIEQSEARTKQPRAALKKVEEFTPASV